MTINVKCSAFLEDNSGAGWSENFYVSSTDLVTARDLFDTIIPDIMALRPDSVTMIWARASDVVVRGDSLLSALPFPVPGTYTLPTGATQMEPGAAVLIQLFASATSKGHWFFRGGPSSILSGRDFVSGTTWDTDFTTLKTAMVGTFKIRHKTSSGPPPTYSYDLLSNMTPERGTTRRAGRPFGLPVGRRR